MQPIPGMRVYALRFSAMGLALAVLVILSARIVERRVTEGEAPSDGVLARRTIEWVGSLPLALVTGRAVHSAKVRADDRSFWRSLDLLQLVLNCLFVANVVGFSACRIRSLMRARGQSQAPPTDYHD